MVLEGRHALVTGGGRGLGRAIAVALSDAGAIVTVVGRSERHLAEVVARGHAKAFVVADVTDERRLKDGLAQAADRGAIDILVANAGGSETAPFAKAEPDQFRRMFELNVMGTVHAVRGVLGGMVARGFGRIVAVASTAGLKGYAYVSAYCAAKHAVVGLVRALAIETATTGVTVNAVCPGYSDTDMIGLAVEKIAAKTGRTHADVLAEFENVAPIGRLIRPDEVAAAVLSLCLPQASAVTGTTLAVAGGEM